MNYQALFYIIIFIGGYKSPYFLYRDLLLKFV